MTLMFLDLETTIRNTGEGSVGDFKASPFHADNVVVMAGWMWDDRDEVFIHPTAPYIAHSGKGSESICIVGQNLGFDLLYLLKENKLPFVELARMSIWDIQQVEYLLSGQTHLYPSLDEMAIKRGLPPKDDKIKAYWDAGVDTDKIPAHMLREYLEHDVRLTQAIYYDQLGELLDKPELHELVKVKMDDLLATVLMEHFGMAFDREKALALAMECENEMNTSEHALVELAYSQGWPKECPFDPAKNEHVSAMLFGGKVRWMASVPVYDEHGEPTVYKTGARKGEIRTRKQEVEQPFRGLVPASPLKTATKKSEVYKVDDEILSAIRYGLDTPMAASYFAGEVLFWRAEQKDLSTYYQGYSSLVWPDSTIHPSFNHAATRTGRQSCTKPNLQNVTKGDDE